MRNALGNHALVLIEVKYSKYPYGFFCIYMGKVCNLQIHINPSYLSDAKLCAG